MNSFKRFDLFHRCHAFVIRHSVKVHTLYCTFARKKSENAILYIKSEQLTEGGNLAASKIRNLECPSYEICLIDYGCGKFNRKIHIMEQYP